MSVVVIDWLGRGGIAQCTHALIDTLTRASVGCTVVTVAGRELVGPSLVSVQVKGNRLRRHRALANAAAQTIRDERPDTVIVQNYVVPLLEKPVVDAARDVGAKLVWIVHDHQLHSLAAGTSAGLRQNLAASAYMVTHSHYVADRLRPPPGAELMVLPLPVPPEYHLDTDFKSLVPVDPSVDLVLQFGVLKRRYKGTGTLVELVAMEMPSWSFAAVGVGAPIGVDGLVSIPRFVDASDLAATVAAASVTLLPYSHASQSGAVALSQFSGTVPIATAVGGIPEQIEHGETGWLVDVSAPISAWVDALGELSDTSLRSKLSSNCVARALDNHNKFEAGVRKLVG